MRFLKEDSKIRKDLDDLTGKVFGELTVLNYDKEKSRQSGSSYWLCKCSCGKTTSVARKHLINGDIKSCGHTRHQNGLDHTDNFDGMRYRQNKYNTNIEVIKNQKMQPNNTSGVKGVHFNKTRGRWVAGVSVGGKEIRRDFKTKEEAIAYRQELVKKYYLPKIELAKNNGDLKENLSKYDASVKSYKILPSILRDDLKDLHTINKDFINEDYHYGNLDYARKADSRSVMSTTMRGTGHFGTGFYTIGHQEPNSSYSKRDLWEIDLSKYNLYRPTSNQDGENLHRELSMLNNYIAPEHFKGYNENKLLDNLYDYEDKQGYKGIINFAKKYFSNRLNDYNFIEAIKEGRWGAVEDIIKEWISNASDNTYLDYAVSNLSKRFNKPKRQILNLIKDAYYSNSEDSISTVFMKSLGYEGVNVSGLDELDNFKYGSVVYDLKPNTYRKVK